MGEVVEMGDLFPARDEPEVKALWGILRRCRKPRHANEYGPAYQVISAHAAAMAGNFTVGEIPLLTVESQASGGDRDWGLAHTARWLYRFVDDPSVVFFEADPEFKPGRYVQLCDGTKGWIHEQVSEFNEGLAAWTFEPDDPEEAPDGP